jgi:hypothetical protein
VLSSTNVVAATAPIYTAAFLGSSHLRRTWATWPRMLVSPEARQPHWTGTCRDLRPAVRRCEPSGWQHVDPVANVCRWRVRLSTAGEARHAPARSGYRTRRPLPRTGVALGILPAPARECPHNSAYPRIHSDRLANLEIHERLAHRAVGILGALLMPFSFGKGDFQTELFGYVNLWR